MPGLSQVLIRSVIGRVFWAESRAADGALFGAPSFGTVAGFLPEVSQDSPLQSEW